MATDPAKRPAGAPDEAAENLSREDDDSSARAAAIEQDPSQQPPDEDLKRIKGG